MCYWMSIERDTENYVFYILLLIMYPNCVGCCSKRTYMENGNFLADTIKTMLTKCFWSLTETVSKVVISLLLKNHGNENCCELLRAPSNAGKI